MDSAHIKRQYFLYNSVFNGSRALYISTYSLFLGDVLSLSVGWIPWLLVINLVATTVCEIPTGAVADVYGRNKSFLIGCVLTVIGYLAYCLTATVIDKTQASTRMLLACLAEVFLAV